MNGTDSGILNVHIKGTAGADYNLPYWQLSGNQGNYWKRASIQIQSITHYQVNKLQNIKLNYLPHYLKLIN